jgi:hypothetical protein
MPRRVRGAPVVIEKKAPRCCGSKPSLRSQFETALYSLSVRLNSTASVADARVVDRLRHHRISEFKRKLLSSYGIKSAD